jgi:hypothetical protein
MAVVGGLARGLGGLRRLAISLGLAAFLIICGRDILPRAGIAAAI